MDKHLTITVRGAASIIAFALLAISLSWLWAFIFAAIAFLSGVYDRSFGREISDRKFFGVTDNGISWGLLIFLPYLGMFVGLWRHGSHAWAELSLLALIGALVFQLVAEMRNAPWKAFVGAIAASATLLILGIALMANG